MIQIQPSNLQSTAENHWRHCKPYSIKVIAFYKDFFNRIGNKKFVNFSINGKESPKKLYGLDANTIKTMIQPFLKKDNQKKGKSKTDINHIKTLLSSKDLSRIKNINHLNYYRELLKFVETIEKDIDEILKGVPNVLNKIKIKSIYDNLNSDRVFIIQQIFRYDILINKGFQINDNGEKSTWGSYRLTSDIAFNSCVYCNRNWIITVGDQVNKTTNPQLDHFFSKSDFPILRLSFYNLIPSCETCNSRVKGSVEFEYNKNLHPYDNGYGNNAKFIAIGKDVESVQGYASNFSIKLLYEDLIPNNLKSQIEENHKLFEIDKLYEAHGDIVSELFLRKRLFSISYLQTLKKSIQMGENVTEQDLYRIAFSNYFNDTKFGKRPFSKLTRDITKQLGLI